jgi:hypothetical protein
MAFRLGIRFSSPLPPELEPAFLDRRASEVRRFIAPVGVLSGLAIVAFSLWDAVLDPVNAKRSFLIRLGWVLLGAPAYWPNRLRWSPHRRIAWIYTSHLCGVISAVAAIHEGFLHSLGGIVAPALAISLFMPRLRDYLRVILLPLALFLGLSAWRLPLFDFINSALFYVLALVIGGAAATMQETWRKQTFLLERMLMHEARHDALTGAYNRRYLTEAGCSAISLSRRHNRPQPGRAGGRSRLNHPWCNASVCALMRRSYPDGTPSASGLARHRALYWVDRYSSPSGRRARRSGRDCGSRRRDSQRRR